MPTPTEQLVKVEDKILETIASLQKPVVDAVKRLAEKAESVVPEVPTVPGSERLPSVDELVANQFVFAEKLLSQQKEFTTALLEAVKPVSEKVTATQTKPKATKTTKAAA